MKVKDLAIDQEVIINSFPYKYKGIQKIKTLIHGAILRIVFEREVQNKIVHTLNLDLTVGNKELKEVNGKLEFK